MFRENIPNEKEFKITNDKIIKEAIDLLEQKKLRVNGNKGETLNPDVLGYIYEKLINLLTSKGRKGLGAYYTPDEITTFISRETIEKIVIEKIKKVLRKWGGFSLDFNTIEEVLDPQKPIVRDVRVLYDILEEMNTIKILDPAVGSGHFLISAMNVMLDVKKRIYNVMREKINLYHEKLNIILNNLYGVDMDGSAVEITKLRLWLALIENINVEKVKSGEVVLPNIEYNIRQGNSLIGWINENINIMNFIFDEKIENLFIGLKVNAEREEKKKIIRAEEFLKKKSGNLFENYVNAYHLVYEIYRKSFGGKAIVLKDILERIRQAIYKEVTLGYVKNYFPKLNDSMIKQKIGSVKNMLPFHWAVDFGWIIRDGGFDVVIGNPPHGAKISNAEKIMWNKKYSLVKNSHESAKVFVERSFHLLKDNGMFGFVIPKASTYSQAWEDYRDYISQYRICYHIDLDKAFEGVRHEQIVIIAKNEKKDKYEYQGGYYTKAERKIYVSDKIPISIYNKLKILPCKYNKIEMEILDYVLTQNFSNMSKFEIFRGLPRKLKNEKGEKCVKGREIGRYLLKTVEENVNVYESNNKLTRLKRKKIIAQRIVAHVTTPRDRIVIMAYPDLIGILTFETVTNIVPSNEREIIPITVFLNSKFVSWFTYLFIYNKAIRDMDFDAYFVKKIPLPDYSQYRDLITMLGEYIVFLNAVGDSRISYFDEIVDCMIYELYFKNKFKEDGIYEGFSGTLTDKLTNYLAKISFERWYNLYIINILGTKVTRKANNRIMNSNLQKIDTVYKRLLNDKEVNELVRKIKSHVWVAEIEGL